MTTTKTPIEIPLTENRGYAWTTDHMLRMPGPYGGRFHIGAVRRGEEGRQVFQGPMVPGPWAFATGAGTFITSNPEHNSGTESRRLTAAGLEHEVEDGDAIVIDDVLYTVRFTDGFGQKRGRCEFIRLESVRDLRPERERRERLNELLRSMATLAVEAQSETGEQLADTFGLIEGDMERARALVDEIVMAEECEHGYAPGTCRACDPDGRS